MDMIYIYTESIESILGFGYWSETYSSIGLEPNLVVASKNDCKS